MLTANEDSTRWLFLAIIKALAASLAKMKVSSQSLSGALLAFAALSTVNASPVFTSLDYAQSQNDLGAHPSTQKSPGLIHDLGESISSTARAWYRSLFRRERACNGFAALCNRSYGHISHIGAHNSYAVSTNPFAVGANQNVDVIDQLNRGVRLLQGGVHLEGSEVRLCHTDCIIYNGGLLKDYLGRVKGWMDSHPDEVVTLILSNQDTIDMAQYFRPQFQASGLEPMAYVPPSPSYPRDSWPTLEALIISGKRLVVFIDYGADTSKVNYLLPQFENMWETPFSVTDANFPCKVDRVSGSPNGKQYMINHSLNTDLPGVIVPARSQAATTNSYDSIIKHANGCAALADKRLPNFVLLDWVDKGEPFRALKYLNGL